MICVPALPREDNGKLLRTKLLRLFDLREDGRPANWKLAWGEAKRVREASHEIVRVDVDLPEDYAWFEGHFEGYPVLAGAAQLKELILPSVADAFPELGRLESMNRVKFLERIVPGAALRMELSRDLGEGGAPGQVRVRFQIDVREGRTCSVGHLVFAQDESG
jgi:3-hydroxymyristoyl/3-hydroxydecanoyl-(acyl carrier protein) dehydratase